VVWLAVSVRQLIPVVTSRHEDKVDLATAYAYPTRVTRWVRANMVSTVDGASYANGVTRPISGQRDREVFAVLRGLADLILVGAATARAEGYRPAVLNPEITSARERAGRRQAPVIAVVSRALDLDLDAPLFAEAAGTIIVTGPNAPTDRLDAARARCEVIVTSTPDSDVGGVDLAAAVDELASIGYRRILCEGGPRLLARLVAARRLDELCLTISPQLRAGDAARILDGPELPNPARLLLHQLYVDEEYLFARYLVTAGE
jgi:5-amino-6-(5-phosphoribosylamino)uracil reductase